MPIFAARWPDFTLTLVEARNEQDMFELLDEVAEPNAVTYKRLSKPLFLTLKVDQKAKKTQQPGSDAIDLCNSLFDDQSFTDVTFIMSEGEGVKCHKALLASRCEYFKNMFEGTPQMNNFSLKDVHVDTFAIVKKFLYAHQLCIDKVSVRRLIDILSYSRRIGILKLVKLVADKIQRKIEGFWYSDVESVDLCHAYRVTENLKDVADLHKSIKKRLSEVFKDKGKEIEAADKALYTELRSIKNGEEERAQKLKQFHHLLSDGNGKRFVTTVTEFIEKTLGDDGEAKRFNPYNILSRAAGEEPTSMLKKQCLKLISILPKYKFDINWVKDEFNGEAALYSAAYNGRLDLVQALVKAGADALKRVRPNGQTLLHELHEKLSEANSPRSQLIARMNFDRLNVPKGKIKGIEDVFNWLMKHKGYSSIADVPHAESSNEMEIGSNYVDELMQELECGLVAVPFSLNRCEGDSDGEFRAEINKMFHPRAAAVASKWNEETLPDDEESWERLRQDLADAAKKDWQEATRVFHPDPKCRKMDDGETDPFAMEDEDTDEDEDEDFSDVEGADLMRNADMIYQTFMQGLRR